MVSFLAEVKFFRFWPKTMDYNKAFLPKSRRFSAVLLLHSGRCYEAEISAILILLRCPFIWYHFFAEVKICRFWPKTMDYNPWFDIWESKKGFKIPSERPSQGEQNGANVSFVAPSNEEL